MHRQQSSQHRMTRLHTERTCSVGVWGISRTCRSHHPIAFKLHSMMHQAALSVHELSWCVVRQPHAQAPLPHARWTAWPHTQG